MPDTVMDTHYAFQPTTTTDSDVTTSLMGDKVVMKSSEYRKVIKPLLEKRRRARINQCLTELKALLLDVHKADITEPSKLEKADILELTVRHLRDLRRQHRAVPTPYSDPSDKFRAGFTECANEVSACLSNLPGVDGAIKNRLISHLGKCIDRVRMVRSQPAHPQHQIPPQELYPHPVMAQTELYTSHAHQHQHHAQAVLSSPTPPPSPVGRVSPYPVDMEAEKIERFQSTALPAGYASLAVLMSHKRLTDSGIPSPAASPAPFSPAPQSQSVWRPW